MSKYVSWKNATCSNHWGLRHGKDLGQYKNEVILLMFLKSGLSTEGDTESVLLVGPRAPAT